MDISPFYELRNRLYCTASAGCSAVNEDFRLKRAVENFQTLANANKVFGKLYMMCNKLFDSDNVFSTLADCIALADALAVTQGTFNVSAETVPYENNVCIQPADFHYSEYHDIIDALSGQNKYINLQNIDEKQMQFISDPRFLALFIQKVNSGTNSEYFSDFAGTVCRIYGKSIIPLLKNSIDFSNPKTSGNEVRYVSDIAHADENDWYLELALNEDYPQNIRVNAIEALAYCPENTDTLMELYRTQKGKIKNAVLYALAIISPPEADSIWEKMTKDFEKFKEPNSDYIALSGSKVCSDFAKKYIKYLQEKIESVPKTESGSISSKLAGAYHMLANKTDVEDCIIDLIDFQNTSKNFRYSYPSSSAYKFAAFRNIVINNIADHPDNPDFRKLAANLYNRNKEVFLYSEFLIRLREDPYTAFEIVKDISTEKRGEIIEILKNIWYSPNEKQYFINWSLHYNYIKKDAVPVFERIPECILKFLTDKLFIKRFTQSSLAKILENTGSKNKTVKKEVTEQCESVSFMFTKFLGYNGCPPKDYKYIKQFASEFVFDTALKFPNYHSLALISGFLKDESPEKYKNLIYNYIYDNYSQGCMLWEVERYINYLEGFPLSDADKLNEILRIRKIYEQYNKNKYGRTVYELKTIDEYIQKYNEKGNN